MLSTKRLVAFILKTSRNKRVYGVTIPRRHSPPSILCTALIPAKDGLINTSLWESFLLDQHSALSAPL